MTVMNAKQLLDEVLTHNLTYGLAEAELSHPDLHIEAVLSDELKLILPCAIRFLRKPSSVSKTCWPIRSSCGNRARARGT